jgi:hypothetical protein
MQPRPSLAKTGDGAPRPPLPSLFTPPPPPPPSPSKIPPSLTMPEIPPSTRSISKPPRALHVALLKPLEALMVAEALLLEGLCVGGGSATSKRCLAPLRVVASPLEITRTSWLERRRCGQIPRIHRQAVHVVIDHAAGYLLLRLPRAVLLAPPCPRDQIEDPPLGETVDVGPCGHLARQDILDAPERLPPLPLREELFGGRAVVARAVRRVGAHPACGDGPSPHRVAVNVLGEVKPPPLAAGAALNPARRIRRRSRPRRRRRRRGGGSGRYTRGRRRARGERARCARRYRRGR